MALTKFTTDVENIQALSDKPNEIEGLTADQLKKKFDDAAIDLKAYLNETLTVEQDAVNTTVAGFDARIDATELDIDNLQNLIALNGSNQTIIGQNDLRATRFVPLATPILLVNGVDPANTNWVEVDVTAFTSARCYAVTGQCSTRGATNNAALYIRAKGDATAPGFGMIKAGVISTTALAWTSFVTGTDTNQIFEYSASNADITAIYISITGYWEYVD